MRLPVLRITLLGLALVLGSAPPSLAQAPTRSDDRVLALRPATLKAGVSAGEFERYFTTEYAPSRASAIPGFQVYLLKGDRGEGKDRYMIVWEFDSVARRNEYFPTEGGSASERFQQLAASLPPSQLAKYVDVGTHTDYVVSR